MCIAIGGRGDVTAGYPGSRDAVRSQPASPPAGGCSVSRRHGDNNDYLVPVVTDEEGQYIIPVPND